MFQVSGVVKHLLIINVLLFLGTMLLGDPADKTAALELIYQPDSENFSSWGRLRLAMFYPTSEYFRPYQIVTHMFMHADFMHIFFNMYALFLFGPPLERLFGEQRFLIFYLLTGFGALALHLFVKYLELQYGSVPAASANIPVLGASGAVFGLLVGFGMKFPKVVLQLIFPPIALQARYFVLIYIVLELFLGLSPYSGGGVAHWAHLGGALFGFLLIKYWDRPQQGWK